MSELPGYITVGEFAEREGVHPETIKRRLRAGQLKGVKMPGRIWLIPEPAQSVRSCMGCANKPIGEAPAGRDSDGNLWHHACSSALLARYARHIIERNGTRPCDKGAALQDESRQ